MGDTTYEATFVGKTLSTDAILADYATRIAALEAGGGSVSDEALLAIANSIEDLNAKTNAPTAEYVVSSSEAGADYTSLTDAVAAIGAAGVTLILRGTVTEPAVTSARNFTIDGMHIHFDFGVTWNMYPTGSTQPYAAILSCSNITLTADGPVTIAMPSAPGSAFIAPFAIGADISQWHAAGVQFDFSFTNSVLGYASGMALFGRTSTAHNLSFSELGTVQALGTITSIPGAMTMVDVGMHCGQVRVVNRVTNAGTARDFILFEGSGEGATVCVDAFANSGWFTALCSGDSANTYVGWRQSGVSVSAVAASSTVAALATSA